MNLATIRKDGFVRVAVRSGRGEADGKHTKQPLPFRTVLFCLDPKQRRIPGQDIEIEGSYSTHDSLIVNLRLRPQPKQSLDRAP